MKILETPRLILRTWQESDLKPFSAMNQDPAVMEFFPSLLTPEESAGRIEWQNRHFKEHGFCCFAVELKATGEFIGFIGLSIPAFEAPFMPAVEIGWRIAQKYWNQGYATEGAKYVLNYAFNDLNLKEVVSFAAMTNKKSMRIMEKIGMTHDPKDDFDHPKLAPGHSLRRHVLYRLTALQVEQKDKVELEAYDPQWTISAQAEISKIKNKISEHSWFVGMEHFGSTAVPGLTAKAILDLAIGVNNLEAAKLVLVPLLSNQGYVFWESNPDKTKLFFVKGMPPLGEKRTHHIHVYDAGGYDWLVRPLFRDYLISHPDEKQNYENLKEDLAGIFKLDREAYTQAKTEFILGINQKAVKFYLNFRPLGASDFPVLLKWFNQPHVQEFYSLRTWTLEEVQAKFKERVLNTSNISHGQALEIPKKMDSPEVPGFIACIHQTPIGYLQCYAVKNYPWPDQDFSNFPSGFIESALGLDFFIGEASCLGKKIAALVLEEFLEQVLEIFLCKSKSQEKYKFLVVDPDIKNIRSIKFFAKQGFQPHQIIACQDALGLERQVQLMVRVS